MTDKRNDNDETINANGIPGLNVELLEKLRKKAMELDSVKMAMAEAPIDCHRSLYDFAEGLDQVLGRAGLQDLERNDTTEMLKLTILRLYDMDPWFRTTAMALVTTYTVMVTFSRNPNTVARVITSLMNTALQLTEESL